jgi:hypothetical protein
MSNGLSQRGVEPADVSTVQAEPTREYVSAGNRWIDRYNQYIRALPTPVDDVDQKYGDDVYRNMLRGDPVVSASINVLKAGVLEDGCTLAPAVTKAGADGYDQAQEINAFCSGVLENLPVPLIDVLYNMLDAICYGNKVAELTYRQDGASLVLDSIKVKPRKATAFVVDQFYNVLGLIGRFPGSTAGSLVVTDKQDTTILPLEKFAILTFRPRDNDPRGTSILRPAYNGWWLKQQAWVEFLKYLTQFASASVWATTAQGARKNPGDSLSPQEELLAQLMNFRNGAAIAVPFGTQLNMLASSGEGQAFHKAFDLFNREMVTGILHQTRATMEAQHGSKADSETGQDVLDTLVRQIKKSLQRMVQRDILTPLVRYNYGDAAAALTPLLSLGTVEEQDRSAMWTALAALMGSGFIDASQLPGLDIMAGLPQRVLAEAPPTDTPPEGADNGQS